MANVGSAAPGKTLIGAGVGASPTYASIGTNSGLTTHGVVVAEGNGAFSATATGTAGQVLTSNGSGADPSFQTLSLVTSVLGTANQITATPSGSTVTLSIPSTFIAPGSIASTTLLTAGTNLALPTTSSSSVGNLSIGGADFLHAYGNQNVFLGLFTGNYSLTGTYDTGLGYGTLNNLTSGTSNTAVGGNAGNQINSGSFNTCIGYVSGTTITTTSNNTYLGYFSGYQNTGGQNVGIGSQALLGSGSGSDNTAVGFQAGKLISSGTDNAFLGYTTADNVTTGSFNTAIGDSALNAVNSGSYNTALGYSSATGYVTGTESSNICIMAVGTNGESNVMRLGTTGSGNGQVSACYIAGIDGVNVGSVAKVVTEASDKLGTATITAGTGITITPTANTITVSTNGSSVANTITGNSGGAISPSAGNWNLLGTGSITISGSGSTLTTQLTGLTNHAIQVGAGTATLTQIAVGSTGQVLQANSAADPTWSTATYPATTTANQILYSSTASVVSGLATANSGVLATNASGVPSIDTTNFAVLSTGLQLKGNNTNTAPPAGFIGEQISSYLANPGTGLSSTTTIALTSINLTAGVWDISCLVGYVASATTSFTKTQCSINTTQSVITANLGDSAISFQLPASIGAQPTLAIPIFRALLSATTTYYLNVNATFTVGSFSAYGRISATRVG